MTGARRQTLPRIYMDATLDDSRSPHPRAVGGKQRQIAISGSLAARVDDLQFGWYSVAEKVTLFRCLQPASEVQLSRSQRDLGL